MIRGIKPAVYRPMKSVSRAIRHQLRDEMAVTFEEGGRKKGYSAANPGHFKKLE